MFRATQLVGFGIGPGGGPITTLSYITHTTSTTGTIVAPATILAGDVLVLIDMPASSNTTIPTNAVPTDFTEATTVGFNSGTTAARITISYKIAIGDEDGATITGMDGSGSDGKIMFQYRGDSVITSLSVGGAVSAATNADPAQQTIAAASGTAPVLGIAVFQSTGTISPRTTSITPDHSVLTQSWRYAHDYIQNSSPADYTFDMDDEGDRNILCGVYFHNFAWG